jgi:hypothetical protein
MTLATKKTFRILVICRHNGVPPCHTHLKLLSSTTQCSQLNTLSNGLNKLLQYIHTIVVWDNGKEIQINYQNMSKEK